MGFLTVTLPSRLIFLVEQSPADPVGISTLLVQLGLAGVFLWQWMTERNQRIKRDDQMIALLERSGPLLAEAVATLKEVQDSQKSQLVKSSLTTDDIAKKLGEIAEDLHGVIRNRN